MKRTITKVERGSRMFPEILDTKRESTCGVDDHLLLIA